MTAESAEKHNTVDKLMTTRDSDHACGLAISDIRIGPNTGCFTSMLFSRVTRLSFRGREGQVRTQSLLVPGGSDRLSRITSTGHRIILEETRNIAIILPARGRLSVTQGGRAQAADHGAMLWVLPEQRDTTVEPDAAGLYVADLLTFDAAHLARWQDVADTKRRPPALAARRGGQVQMLRRQIALAADLILQNGQRAPLDLSAWLEDMLAVVYVDLTSDPEQRLRPIPLKRVQHAEQILRATYDGPLSISHIAQQLQVGLRSLELDFRAVYGLSPRAYLMRLRLQRAQERLLAADPCDSVTRIALDCGFSHLGRFAGAYRAEFGESPRQTLARTPPRRPRRS